MTKEIPFFEIGNEEMARKPKLKETILCHMCGKKHKVLYGEKILKDRTKIPSKMLAYYKCKKVSYLCGIAGTDIR